ncbi:uncharacterized protein LOC111256419 [Setaria italica]|uniref:uncharacterized protein LOC111256419 n=1 Tax=Setaria italica TaxID=4555 RepID=UPI000BE4CCD5|nr:uncharacterized protein LOC111256419 [Setaria italica]
MALLLSGCVAPAVAARAAPAHRPSFSSSLPQPRANHRNFAVNGIILMFYPCACSIAADAVQGAAGDLRFPVPAFLALLAIADWLSCVKGVHSGQMVLKVVEAIGEMFFQASSLICSVNQHEQQCLPWQCLSVSPR